ncbi:Manganese/iron superoxide dismutase, C-terminal [Phaffia rhodozyma]|uniref:Manganese/iron superoxide dismutase, C-terminal n=1 Tax=Phaffia rhodozyma TaxID=264483 RepID=A0A0F7SGF9_PHARH|nr:Manganese/iron superoxide dismutase, C-terminal [Phaffia rhodozyma]
MASPLRTLRRGLFFPSSSCATTSSSFSAFSSSSSSRRAISSTRLSYASSAEPTPASSETAQTALARPEGSRIGSFDIWSDRDVDGFLSARSVKVVAHEYQRYLMSSIKALRPRSSSPLQTATVQSLVSKTAVPSLSDKPEDQSVEQWTKDCDRLFKLSCEALNNNFFLSSLRDTSKPGQYPYQISKHIVSSFGSNSGFEQTLIGTASGLSSDGWLWLVQDPALKESGLALVTSQGEGTMLVSNGRLASKAGSDERLGFLASGMDDQGRVWGELASIGTVGVADQQDADTFSEKSPVEQDTIEGNEAEEGSPSSSSSSPSSSTTPSIYDLPPIWQELESSTPTNALSHEDMSFRSTIVPLACINLHEHAYVADHGVWGKEAYVKAWLRAVDWQKVQARLVRVQASMTTDDQSKGYRPDW